MTSQSQSSRNAQYVSFRLGEEVYALDISYAREIVDAPALTQLPSAPPWIPGLMNLRGHILPVVDLKKKFGLDTGGDPGGRAYVVVAELDAADGRGPLTVGVLVDAVLEVFDLQPADLGQPPKFGARFSRSYLLGMTRRGEAIVAVMDAQKVLSDTDVVLEDMDDLDLAASA